MRKILIIFLFSFLIVTFYEMMFSEKYSKLGERQEVVYKVKVREGIIGCLTAAKFQEALAEYRKNNLAAVQKMITDGACFSFQQGDELTALSETCDARDDDNDVFAFKSKKVWLREVYLPCFAVRN